MRRRPQLLPSLTILSGAGLLLAAVYREAPPWLGIVGVTVLFAGGVWALRSSGVDRRQWFGSGVDAGTGGDGWIGHHHGHHHGGFDGGSGFDGGGGGGFDGGGGGGGDGGGG